MYIFIINDTTTDLIETMNSGVHPEEKDFGSFFVYHGKDKPAEILPFDDMMSKYGDVTMTQINLLHQG